LTSAGLSPPDRASDKATQPGLGGKDWVWSADKPSATHDRPTGFALAELKRKLTHLICFFKTTDYFVFLLLFMLRKPFAKT
jgi:hypothetical protein